MKINLINVGRDHYNASIDIERPKKAAKQFIVRKLEDIALMEASKHLMSHNIGLIYIREDGNTIHYDIAAGFHCVGHIEIIID